MESNQDTNKTLDACDSASGETNCDIQNLQVITRVSRIYKTLQYK